MPLSGSFPHSGSSYRSYPLSHEQFKAPFFLADKSSSVSFFAGDAIDPFSFQRNPPEGSPAPGEEEEEEGEEGEE